MSVCVSCLSAGHFDKDVILQQLLFSDTTRLYYLYRRKKLNKVKNIRGDKKKERRAIINPSPLLFCAEKG